MTPPLKKCGRCGNDVRAFSLRNAVDADGTIVLVCRDCSAGYVFAMRPPKKNGKYNPDLLETWVSPVKVDGRWHLYESGPREAAAAACGLTIKVAGVRSVVRSHWPEYACGPCIGHVRATTSRIGWKDARRERDPLAALLDDVR